MTQLTLRWKDKRLDEKLSQYAASKDLSLNKAALQLIRQGAGLEKSETQTIGNSLDEFIGSLSEDDEKEILDAVRIFDEIQKDLWE